MFRTRPQIEDRSVVRFGFVISPTQGHYPSDSPTRSVPDPCCRYCRSTSDGAWRRNFGPCREGPKSACRRRPAARGRTEWPLNWRFVWPLGDRGGKRAGPPARRCRCPPRPVGSEPGRDARGGRAAASRRNVGTARDRKRRHGFPRAWYYRRRRVAALRRFVVITIRLWPAEEEEATEYFGVRVLVFFALLRAKGPRRTLPLGNRAARRGSAATAGPPPSPHLPRGIPLKLCEPLRGKRPYTAESPLRRNPRAVRYGLPFRRYRRRFVVRDARSTTPSESSGNSATAFRGFATKRLRNGTSRRKLFAQRELSARTVQSYDRETWIRLLYFTSALANSFYRSEISRTVRTVLRVSCRYMTSFELWIHPFSWTFPLGRYTKKVWIALMVSLKNAR